MCSGRPLDENELEHMTANEILEQSGDMDFSKLKERHPETEEQARHIDGIPDNREGMD